MSFVICANAKRRTNKSAKCFQFFEKKRKKKTAKRFCIYNIFGVGWEGEKKKSAAKQPRLSQFAQDKRQLPPPPRGFKCKFNISTKLVGKCVGLLNEESRRHRVDTYPMDEIQTEEMTHQEDDGISYYSFLFSFFIFLPGLGVGVTRLMAVNNRRLNVNNSSMIYSAIVWRPFNFLMGWPTPNV